jgi:hypothetical protein
MGALHCGNMEQAAELFRHQCMLTRSRACRTIQCRGTLLEVFCNVQALQELGARQCMSMQQQSQWLVDTNANEGQLVIAEHFKTHVNCSQLLLNNCHD